MKLLVWIVFLLGTAAAVAQDNPIFDPSLIVTKKGDSLKCFVRVDAEYGSKIVYKKEKDGGETTMRTKDVKFIMGAHQYLENIQVGKKELLMILVVKGKAFLFLSVATGAARRQSVLGVSTQAQAIPLKVYVVKKGSIYTEVKRERYREILSALMFDCPALSQRMRSNEKAYRYEEMSMVVEAYNSCR